MPNKKSKETKKRALHRELVAQLLTLAASAFGLVAALAWNEVIRETINTYIKPIIGGDSGIISLFTYALTVTILAVTVTYYLSKVKEKI
jgi:uncharacterized membrane protein (DUF106 family)